MKEELEEPVGGDKITGELEDLEFGKVSDRREKRKAFYEKIERKINIIKEIRELIDECAELDFPEIKEICQKKIEAINSSFSNEIVQGVLKLETLRKEFQRISSEVEEISEKIRNLEEKKQRGEVIDEQEFRRLDNQSKNLDKKEREVFMKIRSLEKNNDILFLSRIRSFFERIIEKRKETIKAKQDYQKDPELFFEELLLKTGLNFKKIKEKIKVRFSGYSVNIILPPEDFNNIAKESPKINGFHIPGSIFNIIKEGVDEEKVIIHENNHNLTESFLTPPLYWHNLIKKINDCIERYKRMKEIKESGSFIEKEEKILKETIEIYFSRIADEVVADIDLMAEGEISTFFADFLKTINEIYQLDKPGEDEKIKKIILNSCKKIEDRFVEFLSQISTSFFIAKRERKIDEIKAAIILFRPEEILRRLKKFTKYLIGEKKYEIYQALENLIFKGYYFKQIRKSALERKFINKKDVIHFFNFNNVKKLDELLQDVQEEIKLTNQDLENITYSIENLEPFLIFEKDKTLLNLEKFSKYQDYLKNISEKLEIKPLADFKERLNFHFCVLHLEKAVRDNNYQELNSIFEKWKKKKELLKTFLEAIKLYIEEGFIFDDYKKYQNIKYTIKTIKQSTFFEWLKKNELDEKIEINF